MFEILGWLGSILLACCALPEIFRTLKDGKCHIGWGLLLMWFFGEVFVLIHILNTSRDYALLFNYTLNCLLLSVMIFYKIRK